MSVAVIGAGWAGLAAAAYLLRAKASVHVFEAAPQAGGRARTIRPPSLGIPIDNGQHVLLGACRQTLSLMRQCGIRPKDAFHIQPLDLAALDGQFRVRFAPLPAPWNRLGAIFLSHGLQGLSDWRHLHRVLHAARRNDVPAQWTALQWLSLFAGGEALIPRLWKPLCLAALNTPIEQASARLLARLLREGPAGSSADSHVLIPRGHLHDLWPATICQRLGPRLIHQRITRIQAGPTGWMVNEAHFDQVILATPETEARRLLHSLPGAQEMKNPWPRFQHSAIATLTLQLHHPWEHPHPMAMLNAVPGLPVQGDWLFNRRHTAATPEEQCLLHIVIARSNDLSKVSSEQVRDSVVEQISRQTASRVPAVRAYALVNEKRATFDALAHLQRPATRTAWPGLFLAGDWTATGYPATLEGAVCSGRHAALSALAAQSA